MILHAAVHLMVVEIGALVDEGLTHQVIGPIVEVLRSESCRINGSEARVSAVDDMPFNQSHRLLLWLLSSSN
jgi:hypothetical protein